MLPLVTDQCCHGYGLLLVINFKMAAVRASIRRTLNWFKVTWSEQPILFAASVIGGVGKGH